MLPDLSRSNFRKMDWGRKQRVRAGRGIQPSQPAPGVAGRGLKGGSAAGIRGLWSTEEGGCCLQGPPTR